MAWEFVSKPFDDFSPFCPGIGGIQQLFVAKGDRGGVVLRTGGEGRRGSEVMHRNRRLSRDMIQKKVEYRGMAGFNYCRQVAW